MNRTHHFQVDNGLFVAEYYIGKRYTEITEEDLRENLDKLADKVIEKNKLGTLSSMTHPNSALTQGSQGERPGKIKEQMNRLLDSVGSDRNCIICGEKRVNLTADLPYSSLLYGLASQGNYMNRGNNLKTIDVCPICLILSMLGFLNTEKVSYAFVYMSDSDEYMREITKEIQKRVKINTLLDIKQGDIDKTIIPVLTDHLDDLEDNEYEGLNYVTLVRYTLNMQNPGYWEESLSKESLNFLRKAKYQGLYKELLDLGLVWFVRQEANIYNRLTRMDKKVSIRLYELIKEESMTKEEIKLIERVASKLVEYRDVEGAIKGLRGVSSREEMRGFLIEATETIDLGLGIRELDTIIQRNNEFRDYIILEINTKYKNKGEK